MRCQVARDHQGLLDVSACLSDIGTNREHIPASRKSAMTLFVASNTDAISAGHGVHRPKTRAVGAGFKPALDRPGSKLPGGARPGFSAGHGVDRSFSQATSASVPARAGLKPAPTRKTAVARSGVFAPLRLCGSARAAAGHGVHRPKSRAVGAGFKPALDRPGSKLPGGAGPGFSAGHGVDRSFSQATTASVPTRAGLKPAPTRKTAVARSGVFAPLRLCGSALVSAGHGVHRRFFARRAVVRSPAATNR